MSSMKTFGAWASFCLVGACSDPGGTPAGGGTVKVQISGEELATGGFLFPTGSEVTISDGWELRFDHVLVTIGNVALSSNPDRDPTDQSQTGSAVARAKGTWAVDLHRDGTVPGVGGDGTATPLATIESQTENGGAPFAADERYAFGYDVVRASAAATRVNFDDDAGTLYDRMVSKGYTVLYTGTATFKGEACETTDDAYDFGKFPTVVPFELGFEAPTSYVNCQNQENQGDPFADEEYQRGIPIPGNTAAIAQIVLHLDHAFYSAVEHEPRLFFDQIAARLVGKPDGAAVTVEDLTGVDPSAFTDGEGSPIPFRICDGSPLPSTKEMSFDHGSVPLDPSADPKDALRDYRDFITYVTSSQGHLNGGEGICFVRRNYASPR